MEAIRTNNMNKGADQSSKEQTAPISKESDTISLYPDTTPEYQLFGEYPRSSKILDIYDHLKSVLDLLGIEWRNSVRTDSDIQGVYIRNENQSPLLVSGFTLHEGTHCGSPTEIIMLAKTIALHVATTAYQENENVQAVYTWKDSESFDKMCQNTCQIEESLNPCSQCRMRLSCRPTGNSIKI